MLDKYYLLDVHYLLEKSRPKAKKSMKKLL